MSLERIQTLIESAVLPHDRLFQRDIKCDAAKLRKILQQIAHECKLLRKQALDHRKALPIKKRKKKDAEEQSEELPEPTELQRETTKIEGEGVSSDVSAEKKKLLEKLALLEKQN